MPSETVYVGVRTPLGCEVFVTRGGRRQRLPMRQDLWSHSPDGAEWGYGGSGPAQLALALLADVQPFDDVAVELHQAYKWDVVAKLPRAGWNMTSSEIKAWLSAHNQEEAEARAMARIRTEGGEPVDLLEEEP